ncbi:hypothetical protein [Leptospira idonii]|uniref:Uncharacterized protein n=1 Tax=Leptospira idonii TaxID=1193500 RepID=A0A4R9M1R5_9LEPT|nr:hypothetical protein [Leptospira idonii]TGN19637.1 hypothetical protein EHS15_07585 [Leptospira idonii]
MSIPAITMATANSIQFSELGIVSASSNSSNTKMAFRQKAIDKRNTELCQDALDRLRENTLEYYPGADAVIILNMIQNQGVAFNAIGIAIKYK